MTVMSMRMRRDRDGWVKLCESTQHPERWGHDDVVYLYVDMFWSWIGL